MDSEIKEQLLHAASLLTKAASQLEYAGRLEKEASAVTNDLIARGVAQNDLRDTYKDYFTNNPDKIASIKEAFKDLPVSSGNVLGEVSDSFSSKSALDDFDRAVLGF